MIGLDYRCAIGARVALQAKFVLSTDIDGKDPPPPPIAPFIC